MKRIISKVFMLATIVCTLSCGSLSDSDIGLVLGGGGAKAAAHIGVLKVIEEAEVPIGSITGSSMGAVVGALYAAGYSADSIEKIWLEDDLMTLFDKDELPHFEKGSRTMFGVLKGDVFEARLNQLLNDMDFEDLPIKFCCVATQIENKRDIKEVDITTGNVARAVRASMSYPLPIAGYPSVEIDGMRLVDGGMMNNLPVDVADSLMGASRIIAVDLEMKQRNNITQDKVTLLKWLRKSLGKKFELSEDLLDLGWLVEWMITNPNVNKHNANRLRDDIIYIHPEGLSNYGILSFDKESIKKMIEEGQKEAKQHHWQQLQDLTE